MALLTDLHYIQKGLDTSVHMTCYSCYRRNLTEIGNGWREPVIRFIYNIHLQNISKCLRIHLSPFKMTNPINLSVTLPSIRDIPEAINATMKKELIRNIVNRRHSIDTIIFSAPNRKGETWNIANMQYPWNNRTDFFRVSRQDWGKAYKWNPFTVRLLRRKLPDKLNSSLMCDTVINVPR